MKMFQGYGNGGGISTIDSCFDSVVSILVIITEKILVTST